MVHWDGSSMLNNSTDMVVRPTSSKRRAISPGTLDTTYITKTAIEEYSNILRTESEIQKQRHSELIQYNKPPSITIDEPSKRQRRIRSTKSVTSNADQKSSRLHSNEMKIYNNTPIVVVPGENDQSRGSKFKSIYLNRKG